MSSEKSKLYALLLCIFLGFVGAHCFYAGNRRRGILYACTLGLLFVGVIYDIVRILRNQFRDADGCVLDIWVVNLSNL